MPSAHSTWLPSILSQPHSEWKPAPFCNIQFNGSQFFPSPGSPASFSLTRITFTPITVTMQFSTLLGTTLAVLASTSLACVQMTATVNVQFSVNASLRIVDDGVEVCKGSLRDKCAGVIQCSTSPRWHWAYLDACGSSDKGPRVEYETDHGKWVWDGMSGSCNNWNCCGGNIPCNCKDCSYSLRAFC